MEADVEATCGRNGANDVPFKGSCWAPVVLELEASVEASGGRAGAKHVSSRSKCWLQWWLKWRPAWRQSVVEMEPNLCRS